MSTTAELRHSLKPLVSRLDNHAANYITTETAEGHVVHYYDLDEKPEPATRYDIDGGNHAKTSMVNKVYKSPVRMAIMRSETIRFQDAKAPKPPPNHDQTFDRTNSIVHPFSSTYRWGPNYRESDAPETDYKMNRHGTVERAVRDSPQKMKIMSTATKRGPYGASGVIENHWKNTRGASTPDHMGPGFYTPHGMGGFGKSLSAAEKKAKASSFAGKVRRFTPADALARAKKKKEGRRLANTI